MLSEKKLDPMNQFFDSTLNYGHVGRAVYLPDSKTWTFSRSSTRPPLITYTGITTNAIPSPHNVSKTEEYNPYDRPPTQRLIPYAHPDLAAHWVSINDDVFSNFVTTTTDIYDPQVSTLLDLGSALSTRHFDHAARVPIAAAVTGDCSTTITFRLMREDKAELENGGLIRAPAISDPESTAWSTNGARIRQICFARPVEGEDEGATWMAARLTESTVFFRPLYRQNPAAMHIYHNDPFAFSSNLHNSRLDANPTVEIFSSHTGGFPHADVAFNPWWQRQVAIVDTRGNWSIWVISGRLRKANWLVTPGQKGSLPILDQNNTTGPRHDGWASIEWIANFSSLLVADRRRAMLFQIDGEEIRSSPIRLGLLQPHEWILDMRRSCQNPSQFFILTTTRLLWFDILPVSLETGSRPYLRPLTAWRHFRDIEDTTLRISELLIRSELYLVLYSRVADVVQVFPCPVTTDEDAEAVTVSDPFLLSGPLMGGSSGSEKSKRYSTLVFKEVEHSPIMKENYNFNMTIIKLFWADSSLAINETIYRGPDKDPDEQDEFENDKSILRVARHYRPRKEPNVADDSNFIVNDWDDSVVVPQVIPTAASKEVGDDLEWTLDFSPLYELAVADIAIQSGEHSDFTFEKMINKLKSEEESSWRAGETMLEHCGGRPVLDDIDKNSEDFEHLVSLALAGNLDSEGNYFRLLSTQLSHLFPGMPVISAGNQFGLSLVETYDSQLDEWISSLPNDIPTPTRRMKEKIVRGIALDILLSRLICTFNQTGYQPPSQAIESVDNDQSTEVNLTPCGLGVPISMPSSEVYSSQSVVATDDGSQLQADIQTTSAPLYYHLSAFTTFKKPRIMTRKVNRLLFNWQPSADPSTFVQQNLIDKKVPIPSKSRKRKAKSLPRTTTSDGRFLPSSSIVRVWGSQSQNVPSSQVRNVSIQTETKKSKKKKKRRPGF